MRELASFWELLRQEYGLAPFLVEAAREAEAQAAAEFATYAEVARKNQLRVLRAFQQAGITELHLKDGTGYGYGDAGREGLERVWALAFGAEAALVRAQIISGTHALALGLTSLLHPGDELVIATGRPYDTLARILGHLAEEGITAREVPLDPAGRPDYARLKEEITPRTRLVLIQRSRGYSLRPSLGVAEIGRLVKFAKGLNPNAVCLVANCSGEFVEEEEPTHVGADLVAGSLIKNPGGGLAPSGGYLAGKRSLVRQVADRLVAPGLGEKMGTNLGIGRLLYQGLFLAPSIVGEALKGAVFAAHFLSLLGFETLPPPGAPRTDIVQVVLLGSPEEAKAFCRGIQAASPVDAGAVPEPGELPGYEEQILMAAGTFVQGASLELTADCPLRPPYAVYFQGGLSYGHAVIGVLRAVQELVLQGFFRRDGAAV